MTKYEKIVAGGPRYLAKIIASIKIGYRKKIAKLQNFNRPWDVWKKEEDLLAEAIHRELMLDEENIKLQQKIKELEKQLALQQSQLARANEKEYNDMSKDDCLDEPEARPFIPHLPFICSYRLIDD